MTFDENVADRESRRSGRLFYCRLPISDCQFMAAWNRENRQSAIGNWQFTMDSLTYTQLLRRNRSFRRLWLGQAISELGNWFNFIAALGVVRVVSHAARGVPTIILLSRLVPFTLFSPLAGAFVDRWSRRNVMIATDLLRV